MSMIKDHTTTTTTKPPSPSTQRGCFLGCFGCSGKNIQHKDRKVNSNSRQRNWISKLASTFKKSKIKTVPVDQTTVPRKSKSGKHKWEIQVVEDDAKSNTKWTDSVTRQNGSFRSRRKETKPTVITSTKPAAAKVELPEKKTESISTHPLKPLTQSKSLPQPLAAVIKGSPKSGGGVVKKTTPFDSMVGMSIILVTLVIMMLWGKLCAILCTCAWFFIAPRLGEHVAVAPTEKRWPELDLESVEYKKKVVLEGLLQRNHRNVVGRL